MCLSSFESTRPSHLGACYEHVKRIVPSSGTLSFTV
jgi:hypothetical protein